MNKPKRSFARMAIAIGVMCGVLSGWADTFTDADDHVWTYTTDATSATVTGVDPARGVLTIPSELGGKPVVSFGTTFKEKENVARVTIPAGVTAIDNQAFLDCKNLKSVTINATALTSIGYQAFMGCSNLENFVIPNSVTTLGRGVFSGCSALEEVTIGDGVETLTGVAYQGNTGGSSSTYYADYGERSGSSELDLKNRYVDGLFYNCTSLKTVNWGANVREIGNVAFLNCTALTDVTLPESVDTIGKHAFCGCSTLKTLVVSGSVKSIGVRAFCHCPALHFVDFRGEAMTSAPGNDLFCGSKERLTVFAAEGSTGWKGVAQERGLPESGTWQGRPITYGPASATAGNPYDFYPYTPTGIRISRTNYDWPSPLMFTKTPYLHGTTIPATVAEFKQGETIYLNFAFNEYWRGNAFENMTNTFALSGSKSAQEDIVRKVTTRDYSYCWGTNVTLNILKDLTPGDYTITMNLNTGKNLAETDSTNNSTTLTFKVISRASYTVTFNAHGGTPTPAALTRYEDAEIGELPVVTRTGYVFNGWYTAETGGTRIAATTKVTANVTCHAQWTKLPNIIFWKPTDDTWTETMFVAANFGAKSGQAEFTEGDPVYLFYACYEADGKSIGTAFVNRFALTRDGEAVGSFEQRVSRISSGWCEGIYGTRQSCLQNLAPGTYTLTCTLDAESAVAESSENDNVKAITFTVNGTTVRVTIGGTTVDLRPGATYGSALRDPAPVSGKVFAGWYTQPGGRGTRVTRDSIVPRTATTLYAYWIDEAPVNPGPGPGGDGNPDSEYAAGDSMPVTVVVNNTTITITVVVGQTWGSRLPSAPAEVPEGKVFAGWYTQPNGRGTKVTRDSIVPSTATTLYAYFTDEERYELYATVSGRLDASLAQVYDGYLRTRDGAVAGSIQVKAAKQKVNRKTQVATSKLTVTIAEAGKKKATFKGELNVATGLIAWSKPKTTPPSIVIGANAIGGSYGSFAIDGGRNVFASKAVEDKAVAASVLSKLQGALTVAAPTAKGWDGLSVVIAAKGKVKVSGVLADGTKVSVAGQLIVGDRLCCVPVVYSKKTVSLAFCLWLSKDGAQGGVTGLGDNVLVGRPGRFSASAMSCDVASIKPSYHLGEKGFEGLKLKVAAKTGLLTGSFKCYETVKGKEKKITVSINGVLIGNNGVGTAIVKKVGSTNVIVE